MKMPELFIGHGSPMNAIEDNEYTRKWTEVAERIPTPKGIISISAHWYTDGKYVNDEDKPKQIYDMYGFPQELYDLNYPAMGSEELASEIISRVDGVKVGNSWGIDHGTWSVLCKMYPDGEIPIVQLSIDAHTSIEEHYEIGRALASFRNEGYLIFGSGNVVHNLMLLNPNIDGYDWAYEFDNYISENILNGNHENVINYRSAGDSAKNAFRTLEHFIPLIYVLGAVREDDEIEIFNNSCTIGSLSMTSYLFK